MATSNFERAVEVLASPAETWRTLTDVPRLASWVGLLEDVTEVEPMSAYQATLADRIGPFRLRADLSIRVVDWVEGSHVQLVADGEDRQVSSRILVRARLALAPTEAGTTIHVEGQYEVTGRVATTGAGMVHKKATTVLNEFFAKATAALGPVSDA